MCGRHRDRQAVRNLVELEPFHVSQHERRTFVGSQLIQERVETRQDLTRLAVRGPDGHFRKLPARGKVKNSPHSPPAELPLECSERHRVDEAAQCVDVAQRGQSRERAEKHVLCEVRRFSVRPERPLEQPENHGGVPIPNRARGPVFAVRRSAHETRIVEVGLGGAGDELNDRTRSAVQRTSRVL